MNVLCFDISTGGLSSAIFDEQLVASDVADIPWKIQIGADGSATLDPTTLLEFLKDSVASKPLPNIDAISVSAFMHNSILLDREDSPLTPIHTWMDRRGDDTIALLRSEFGSDFHQRTGCRYHPMFPVFKVASQPAHRIASAKSLVIAQLTGNWIEDHGTASATGLYNVKGAAWDADILRLLRLQPSALPPLVEREAIVGRVTVHAGSQYGLAPGTPVVAGSGDGFLANLGSGCEIRTRMAVTLGTSASVRQVLPMPVLDEAAGTFCYRAHANGFLFGCASNNGGNVLDWARSVFGALPVENTGQTDLPTFIPLLNAERSPEWDATLTARWHGLESRHTAQDLASSVIEGVSFNLAHYVDILERASGERAKQVILSGNGFLNPVAAEILAAVVDAEVRQPRNPGLASLRGAAVCGLRALGVDVTPHLEHLVATAHVVEARHVEETRRRYARYRAARLLHKK